MNYKQKVSDKNKISGVVGFNTNFIWDLRFDEKTGERIEDCGYAEVKHNKKDLYLDEVAFGSYLVSPSRESDFKFRKYFNVDEASNRSLSDLFYKEKVEGADSAEGGLYQNTPFPLIKIMKIIDLWCKNNLWYLHKHGLNLPILGERFGSFKYAQLYDDNYEILNSDLIHDRNYDNFQRDIEISQEYILLSEEFKEYQNKRNGDKTNSTDLDERLAISSMKFYSDINPYFTKVSYQKLADSDNPKSWTQSANKSWQYTGRATLLFSNGCLWTGIIENDKFKQGEFKFNRHSQDFIYDGSGSCSWMGEVRERALVELNKFCKDNKYETFDEMAKQTLEGEQVSN